mgnify:CR=1 FL=1
MRQYVLVSGIVLAFIACAQLVRLVFGAQVLVEGVEIPLWVSAIAAAGAGALAVWAFRVSSAKGTGPTA